MRPSWVTRSAVTPVVPAPIARIVTDRSWRLDAQLLQDGRVDTAGEHAFLEVLNPGPVGQRRIQVVLAVPQGSEPAAYLVGQLALERQRGGRVGLAEVEVVQVEEPTELRYRRGGVV